jgi:hypothetical protein
VLSRKNTNKLGARGVDLATLVFFGGKEGKNLRKEGKMEGGKLFRGSLRRQGFLSGFYQVALCSRSWLFRLLHAH